MKNLTKISLFKMILTTLTVALIATGCGETDEENPGNYKPDVNIIQSSKTVNVGTKVTISATVIDLDGDDLTYNWKFSQKPSNSSATLENANSLVKETSFTPDVAGKYVITITAKDPVGASNSDSITITAKAVEGGQSHPDPVVVSNSCTTYQELGSTTYTTDTVLDGCYKIDRYIEIAENKLLTIKSGSVLMFTANGYIEVNGALKAVGTPNKPILFTGTTKAAGHWQGIQFNNAVDDRNELANIIIEHAGSWSYGALYATGATKLKIRDSIIRNNKLHGFYFGGDVVLNQFSNVTSTANEDSAGSVHPNALNVIDGTSDFTGNNNNYLTVRSGTINSDQTWSALTVPVLVDRYIEIPSNKFLTINPGANFKFVSSGYIEVYGAVKAVGTAEYQDKKTGTITPAQPITFSGATKAAGHWQGIQFNNAVDDRNELANIVIEHAGSWSYGALYATGATKLKIRDSIIRNNKLHGFYFGGDVVLNQFSNVTSTANEDSAGSVHPNALNVIDGTSDFTGNNNNYLTVRSGTINSDQTWSALTVPVLVDRYIEIPENRLLTIKTGARFKFVSSGYISVNGALKAIGSGKVSSISPATEASMNSGRILFTGATASKGFWQGIQFNNAVDNRNELAHVVIEYAGSWSYGALYVSGATVLNLHDSDIRNNDLFGLWISGDATVTNTNNTFTNNTEGNVHQD